MTILSAASAATVTWDGGSSPNARSWATTDNWDTDALPITGVDSISLNLSNTNFFINMNMGFTLASGQSVVTTENLPLRWGDGGLLTLNSGSTFDLTNGGTQSSGISNNFGSTLTGDDGIVLDAGATARVSYFSALSDTFLMSYNADAAGAITTMQVDGTLSDITGVDLVLDLSAATISDGDVFVLFDYGSFSGTAAFGSETITGLGGLSYEIDYAYEISAGDFGVAVAVIPEPSAFVLIAGGLAMFAICARRRQ